MRARDLVVHRIRRDHPLIGTAILLVSAVLADPAAFRSAAGLSVLLAAGGLLAALVRELAARRAGVARARRLARKLGASLRRLGTSEARYRMMVEHAADPILTFDLGDNLTAMNAAAERLFGWPREALVGAPARRFLAEESVRALSRWARAGLLTPADPVRLELVAVHREGRILHLEAHAAVLRRDGVPRALQLVCRDVSARKELDRLRADFLAMMGHDIRNPLGAIFGYTEMMLDAGVPLATEHRELLLRINSNTRTVLTLVGNFLEVSKIEAGQLVLDRREVDVNAVLRGAAEQYAAHAQLVGVELAGALAAELPPVMADLFQVERIVANLLTNAIKFTPAGGRVTISTERLPSCVAIAVADTGVGIPRHEFARIFQRYARSGDQSREGTGLGLYIVGTLVEAHGGFVTIDSTPGRGTTFTVYLPISDWRPPARAGADVGARPSLH